MPHEKSAGDYDGLAEFHDLFMIEPWQRLRPTVDAAFGHLGSEARILEIGAGTGVGTRVLAAASPARITAIEPSMAMRTALINWISHDEDASTRVTISAEAAPEAVEDHEGRIHGFVCAHMLGHLDASARVRTFTGLRERMSADAVGLITTAPDPDPASPPSTRCEHRRIGDYDYTARYRPDPEGGYEVEYQVSQRGNVIRAQRFSDDWTHLSTVDLIDELLATGLSFEQISDWVGFVRRRS